MMKSSKLEKDKKKKKKNIIKDARNLFRLKGKYMTPLLKIQEIFLD